MDINAALDKFFEEDYQRCFHLSSLVFELLPEGEYRIFSIDDLDTVHQVRGICTDVPGSVTSYKALKKEGMLGKSPQEVAPFLRKLMEGDLDYQIRNYCLDDGMYLTEKQAKSLVNFLVFCRRHMAEEWDNQIAAELVDEATLRFFNTFPVNHPIRHWSASKWQK